MDPFVFDQMFARYAAQVESHAMRRGTELYEQDAVSIRQLGRGRIEGSVKEGRLGTFGVALSDNGSGAFAGSCSCEEVFNCRHSYALARAARDRLVRAAPAPRSGMAAPARRRPTESEAAQAAEKRLGRPANAEERECLANLEGLWRRASSGGWLLYPRDLKPFIKAGNAPSLPGQEPLREFKRMLPPGGPQDALAFADALKCLIEYRDGLVVEPLGRLADSSGARARFDQHRKDVGGGDRWQPLQLKYRARLEPAEERDWYRVTVRMEVEGGDYSPEEIRRLVEANGQPVRLEGKGWRQLDRKSVGQHESVFAALGLEPLRGNQQRIHASQVDALLPEELLDEPSLSEARERVRALEAVPEPQPPASLAGVLRSYQLEGFRFLCQLTQYEFGGILADDMGLGKTLQSLAWLEWLKEQARPNQPFRALVVCPKSVTDNWMEEPARFGCRIKPVLFRPGAEVVAESADANLVVANYAQLRLHSQFFLGQAWDVAILDEGQYIKSPDSQTTKTAYRLQAAQRLVLSGTPVENRLLDLWSLMRFAMPRLLGPRAAFAANYQKGDVGQALEGLRRRIRPFVLRRLKRQVAAELPERIEKELRCELEGEQARLYQEELTRARKALVELDGEGLADSGKLSVLNTVLRLRQICCDPELVDGKVRADGYSPKVQALIDLVEPLVEEGHKILVFSQFVSMLEIIARAFRQEGIAYQMLTGKTQNRGEQVKRFQSDEGAPVFLLSLKAAGSGLNLTAASYVALFDPWWNPAVEAQAIDRTHRIGQRRQVIAYRILAKDTVEEKIREMQSRKAALANAVVEEGDMGESGLSWEMIREALG